MTLLAIIAALFGERFIGSVQEFRQFQWLADAGEWIRRQSSGLDSWIGAILILLLAGTIVELAYLWLSKGFIILGFVAATAVLLFCIGPRSFYDQIKSFCDAYSNGNEDSAYWYLSNLKDSALTDEDERYLAKAALEAAFVAVNNRLLGVIFWFVILGPFGAVIYRISGDFHRLEEEGDQRSQLYAAFDRIHYLLNWPSSRLVSISYAAMGSFVEGMSHLKRSASPTSNWPDPNEQLLVSSGLGALDLKQEQATEIGCDQIFSGLALLRRSVAFWVGVIALLTLAGWLG
ncbi:MAG: regulatory signaling modulator protein AmpE [Gammaproteobacteria bacterium]|nr:regulatory signaling modulator protein AmpE [Gammaproteobacteria bacterium]